MDIIAAQELAIAYTELYEKMCETIEKIKYVDQQLVAEERRVQFAVLTSENVTELPLIVRTYERFGRMFTLNTRTDVRANLEEKILQGRKKIKELHSFRSFLEGTVKSAEDSLRALLETIEGNVAQQ